MMEIHQRHLLISLFSVIAPFYIINRVLISPIPCELYDSTVIDGGRRLSNGSIKYDGVMYNPDQYATIDSSIIDDFEIVSVKNHIRGCVCNIKKCIRLCCPYGHFFNARGKDKVCIKIIANRPNIMISEQIVNEMGDKETIFIREYFNIVDGEPFCKSEQYFEAKQFSIKYTGEAVVNNIAYHHSVYCIEYEQGIDGRLTKKLLVCSHSNSPKQSRRSLLSHGLVVWYPIIILTYLMYNYFSKIHYLMRPIWTLAIGYSVHSVLLFKRWNFILEVFCHGVGWLAFYLFLVPFFALNVTLFDLWFTKNQANRLLLNLVSDDNKRSFYYVIYAFGTPMILMSMIMFLNYSQLLPETWQPGICTSTCFLADNHFIKMLYSYGPAWIAFIISTTLVILIALKIRQIQNDIKNFKREEMNPKHKSKFTAAKEEYVFYLRIWAFMGLAMFSEIILIFASNFVELYSYVNWVFGFQGVITFSMFVLTPHEFKRLKRRWTKIFKLANEEYNSKYSSAV